MTRRTGHKATRPDDKRLTPKLGDGRGNPRKAEGEKRKGYQVSFPQELMVQVDEAAKAAGVSRSEWLANAAKKVLGMEAALMAAMEQPQS